MKMLNWKNCAICSAASLTMFLGIVEATGVKKTANNAAEAVQTKVYDLMDKDITTVSFAKGSDTVTDAEKRDLRSLVNSVRDDAKIDQIVVAAWSDKSLPTPTNGKDLPAADQKLADKRAESVKKILAELGASGIKTYSMATTPSWISEVFGTTESQVKNTVKGHPANDRNILKISETLKSKGGPSTVVVLVKRQNTI